MDKKKKVGVVLAALMLASVLFPSRTFAEEKEEGWVKITKPYSIDMGKYRIDAPNYYFRVIYKDAEIAGFGVVAPKLSSETTGCACQIVPAQLNYILMRDLEDGKKELKWTEENCRSAIESKAEEYGFKMEGTLFLYPDKLQCKLYYEFSKDFKGSVHCFSHFFTNNLENILGAEYEAIDDEGTVYKGRFPKEKPESFYFIPPDKTRFLKSLKIKSPLGLIELKFNMEARTGGLHRFGLGKGAKGFGMSLNSGVGQAGFYNEVVWEVVFE